MSTHEDSGRKPSLRGPTERSFAVVWALFLGAVGCWPLWRGGAPRWWALGTAGAGLLAGLLAPALLRWPNRLWFQLGLLLGRVVTPVVSAGLFFGVFTPMGLFLRWRKKDLLHLAWDPTAESYWIPRTPPGPSPESMQHQF